MKIRVQLNGTAAVTLIEARMNARNAVHAAMAAVAETAPNARDYQHDSTGIAMTIARNAYNARFAALDKLYCELTEEIEDLDAQRTARAAK
jgi:hypothetical protein